MKGWEGVTKRQGAIPTKAIQTIRCEVEVVVHQFPERKARSLNILGISQNAYCQLALAGWKLTGVVKVAPTGRNNGRK